MMIHMNKWIDRLSDKSKNKTRVASFGRQTYFWAQTTDTDDLLCPVSSN